MGINFNFRKMTLGMKLIYSVVAVGIVAAIVIAIVMSRNGYLANTMISVCATEISTWSPARWP